jgi:hypothetical protein
MKGKWVAHHEGLSEWEEFESLAEAKKWLKERHADDIKYGECYDEDSAAGFDFIARVTHRSKFIVAEKKSDYPCGMGILPYCVGSGQCLDCPEDCPHEDPWPYDDAYDEAGEIQMVKQDGCDILRVLEIVKKEFDDTGA